MNDNNKTQVLVLLSGGIDSTVCIDYYLNNNYPTNSIYIDFGQDAACFEYESAKKIAEHYSINLDFVKIDCGTTYGKGEIIGRNAFLVFLVLMKYQPFNGLIAMGLHSGVPYYDTSEIFFKEIKTMVANYTNRDVGIDLPLLTWSKEMVYKYCKKNNVPVEITYSCESGTLPQCGKCLSCLDREIFNAC